MIPLRRPHEQGSRRAGFRGTHRDGARGEASLLLCCARTRLDTDHATRIRALLRDRVDWARLLQTAFRHGMGPVLYRHLSTTCPEAVPIAVLDQLRDHFDANARRNLFLTGELVRLLNLFDTHRIPAIPIKGPALAAAAYGTVALRQFDDLDILVQKRDALKAGELLGCLGYRPELRLSGARARAYLESQCALNFVRGDGRIFVELHWEIVPAYFMPPLSPRLWEHLDKAPNGASGLPTLPPEETLLLLCVHGVKHAWDRLSWISDVAALLHAYEGLDWRRLRGEARAVGGERILYLGLFLARELLGAVLPPEVAQAAETDPAVTRLAEQVRRRLLRGLTGPPGLLERCLFQLTARERLRDRIRYCLRLAVTPTPGDWAFVSLPASLFPLYYLLRPIRLAQKYGMMLARRIASVVALNVPLTLSVSPQGRRDG